MSKRGWRRCPKSIKGCALLARPLPDGVIVTHTERHSERRDLAASQLDLSVEELEWLQAMARGEAPDAA